MDSLFLNRPFLRVPAFIKKPVNAFLFLWIAWILLYFFTYIPTLISVKRIQWGYILFTYLLMASINFVLFYLVAFYLLPLIGIKQKRWMLLAVICLLVAILFSFLKLRLEMFRSERLMEKDLMKFNPNTKKIPNPDSLGFFSYRFRIYLQTNIYTTFSIIIIAFAYRLMLTWYTQERISKELETQKLKAELAYLKLQVNPHFLFNALNNIYSLALIEKCKMTGDNIMKLSELMRYVLYEKEDAENKVSLNKEIQHINNFIDLEKLRHQSDFYINFSIEGDIDDKRIAPLLIFPLIENACKHGILTDIERPIDISLKITDDYLDFSIENYINSDQKNKTGGIGIQNVQKRLELLYGNKYSLNLNHVGEKFIVNLRLPL
ncbi:sensor histidine kinase [Arachidicoccus sp.]|uniref:sensor histidine kinase n=1 Tax=Arachidicoccus sp. TaxID=1872624 RepID=UPI003D25FAC4